VQPFFDFVNRELANEPRPEDPAESAQRIFQITDVALAAVIELLELKIFVGRCMN
jgi:hypothetical protein